MGTYLKTEGIQSCLRIWGIYDPIELGPFEPKNGGLYGCSVKKSDFRAKNGPLYPPRSLSSNMINTKMLSFCHTGEPQSFWHFASMQVRLFSPYLQVCFSRRISLRFSPTIKPDLLTLIVQMRAPKTMSGGSPPLKCRFLMKNKNIHHPTSNPQNPHPAPLL